MRSVVQMSWEEIRPDVPGEGKEMSSGKGMRSVVQMPWEVRNMVSCSDVLGRNEASCPDVPQLTKQDYNLWISVQKLKSAS